MSQQEILEQIRELAFSLQKMNDYYNQYARSINHTYTELQIINLVLEIEDCTQKKIMDASFLPKQTINNVINKLIKLGIVCKEDTSHKNKIISLTEYGQQYAKETLEIVRNSEMEAMNKLSNKERNTLLNLLSKYVDSLDESLIIEEK